MYLRRRTTARHDGRTAQDAGLPELTSTASATAPQADWNSGRREGSGPQAQGHAGAYICRG
jgi:hypothetical protein